MVKINFNSKPEPDYSERTYGTGQWFIVGGTELAVLACVGPYMYTLQCVTDSWCNRYTTEPVQLKGTVFIKHKDVELYLASGQTIEPVDVEINVLN